MGLFGARFRFDGDPPTQTELAAHLVQQLGSARGLDGLESTGSEVLLTCALDTIAIGYAIAYLVARGGVRLGLGSKVPVPPELPAFVTRPWREWSFLQRLRFRFGPTAPLEPPIRDGRYR